MLGTARSLASAGVEPLQLSFAPGVERSSRHLRLVDLPPGVTPESRLPQILGGLELDKAVLLPCSDRWVNEIAALPAAVAHRFPSSSPSAEIARVFTDKAAFARLLSEHSVPTPETRVVENENDLSHVTARDCSRFFLKPTDSQSFFAEFRRKAFDFESGEEALELLERCVQKGLSVILQEYIPGPPSNHFYVEGFVDRRSEICALFSRRRLRMYPARFGNSTAMESVALESVRGAVESMRKLLNAVDYRGIFSAEFKLDARDGVFRLLEVNIRPWWFIEFVASCGVNVAQMAYLDALGRDVPKVEKYNAGRREVYPYYDMHSPRVTENEIGMAQVLASWITARKSVFSWSDPLPACLWAADRVRARMRR